MRKVFIIIACIFLVSCKPGPPWMSWMYDGPPEREDGKEYNPMYVDGWVDGCETGSDANANHFYRNFVGFKQDYEKSRNPVYYKGWKDAFNFCGRYNYQYRKRGII